MLRISLIKPNLPFDYRTLYCTFLEKDMLAAHSNPRLSTILQPNELQTSSRINEISKRKCSYFILIRVCFT